MKPGSQRTESSDPRARASDGTRSDSLFRESARRAEAAARQEGGPLRLAPRWASAVYWTLLGIVLCLLAVGVLAHTHEYASGPAVLRARSEQRLTALVAGTVESVLVSPGQFVQAGEPLMRFHSEEERNVLAHVETEFELNLVNLLRDPSDEGLRNSLAGLRARLDLAKARLAERELTAPSDGWVQDLRIRVGQHLAAGQTVLSLLGDQRHHEVIAFLPGEFRPLLEAGQSVRLIPDGYRNTSVRVGLQRVHDEVLGPQAALDMLGMEWRDAVSLSGPVVVVTALLEEPNFRAGDEVHPFFAGMRGQAEVSVRDRPLLVSLVPGLDELHRKLSRR